MLKIVGDINFADGFFDIGFGVGSLMKRGLNPFESFERNERDFWIGNFECVCSMESNKEGIKRNLFRIDPEDLIGIKHLDLYGVANNHVMQHGSEAYAELLDNIQSFGSIYVGSNGKRSVVFHHQDNSIGMVAFSQREEKYSSNPFYWYSPDYSEIEVELSKISNCDYKIVYVHWGNEFINRPYIDQKKFAHWLIDIGFDIVIGMHPHVLQGFELYNSKYIFYSLGNFVFNMPWEPTHYSIVLKIDFAKGTPIVNFDYVHIGRDYIPCLVSGEDVPWRYRFEYLNEQLRIDEENELYYSSVFKNIKKSRRSNYKSIILNLFRFRKENIAFIFWDYIKRRII